MVLSVFSDLALTSVAVNIRNLQATSTWSAAASPARHIDLLGDEEANQADLAAGNVRTPILGVPRTLIEAPSPQFV